MIVDELGTSAETQGRPTNSRLHDNRHLFITNLERAGIRPKMAQTPARHSDVRLTLDVYTHVDREEQIDAIRKLRAPEDEAA